MYLVNNAQQLIMNGSFIRTKMPLTKSGPKLNNSHCQIRPWAGTKNYRRLRDVDFVAASISRQHDVDSTYAAVATFSSFRHLRISSDNDDDKLISQNSRRNLEW